MRNKVRFSGKLIGGGLLWLGGCLISMRIAVIFGILFAWGSAFILWLKSYRNMPAYIWLFISGVLSISILELLNRLFGGPVEWYSTVYSLLIAVEIFLLTLLLRWNRLKEILLVAVTLLLLVYGTSEYLYYSFFNTYYRVHTILLAPTAAGATASLLEIFTRYRAVCYWMNLLLYILTAVIAWHKWQKSSSGKT